MFKQHEVEYVSGKRRIYTENQVYDIEGGSMWAIFDNQKSLKDFLIPPNKIDHTVLDRGKLFGWKDVLC